MYMMKAKNSVVKSLITATFGVSFPQRCQRGAPQSGLRQVLVVCGWQAEGGHNYEKSHWSGEQGSIKLVSSQ